MSTSHHEIVNNWIGRVKPHLRGYAMFHNGTAIYSWGPHFEIARAVDRPDGRGSEVLYTTRDYSPSTSKHKGEVRKGLHRRGLRYFTVPLTDPRSADDHLFNEQDYKARIEAETQRIARARVNKNTSRLEALKAERREYVSIFIKED